MTRKTVEKDEKGILWIRATPVNLVVSVSKKEIRVWTCKRGKNVGTNVFRLRAKGNVTFNKREAIINTEEQEWEAHERGWDEGYEAGVVDFEEVEKRKQLLRKKGLPVMK